MALNQLAANVIKAQRLRVFRSCGYLPADCDDDDDEFEPKTLYFAAFLAPPPTAVNFGKSIMAFGEATVKFPVTLSRRGNEKLSIFISNNVYVSKIFEC